MFRDNLAVCFGLLSLILLVNSASLPSPITPCHRNDSQLNSCLLREGKKMLKLMLNGYPEFGIPSLKPLDLNNFTISNGADGLTMTASHAVIYGISEKDLVDLKIDLRRKTGLIRLIHDINLICKYDTVGRLLAFPVNGKGNLKVITNGLDWNMFLKWDLVKGKDGKEYMKIKRSKSKYEIEKSQFAFDGLLNDQISEAINLVINENWRDVIRELGDPSLQILQKRYTDILNDFLSRIPFDDLLPL